MSDSNAKITFGGFRERRLIKMLSHMAFFRGTLDKIEAVTDYKGLLTVTYNSDFTAIEKSMFGYAWKMCGESKDQVVFESFKK